MRNRLVAIAVAAVLCGGAVAASALSDDSSKRKSPGQISTSHDFDFGGGVPEESFLSYVVLRPYVAVRRKPNAPVLRAELSDGPRRELSASVEPGRYRISSYQRTCSGTCETLDPVSHGCGRDVKVSPGERVRATITVSFSAEHCKIRLRQTHGRR